MTERFTEKEIPTDSEGARTLRPPSKPDFSETDIMLGSLMASQARLEAAWKVRSAEHETAMREINGLGKCVVEMREDLRDLLKSQGATRKRVNTGIVLAPGVITLIEIGRAILNYYMIGGH